VGLGWDDFPEVLKRVSLSHPFGVRQGCGFLISPGCYPGLVYLTPLGSLSPDIKMY